MIRSLLPLCAGLALLLPLRAADDIPPFTRQEDVIYGRKYGTALTLDILRPKGQANGLGIIYVVSGGWYSGHTADGGSKTSRELLARGYTVFSVVHGSQPKFSIPEIFEDMNRAVRFVRAHAKEYGIDPERLGITGASAGGHLSLMQGMAGKTGKPDAQDPIDRLSSRVQAVACFYPPTDFLNYGKPGENAVGRGILWNFSGAFGFQKYDPSWRKLVPITDEKKIQEMGAIISPINYVTPDDPPTLIIHGDKDWLVPIQQSESILAKLKAAGVKAKLVVKPGADHGWPDMGADLKLIADWFDAHLRPGANGVPPPSAASQASVTLPTKPGVPPDPRSVLQVMKSQRIGYRGQEVGIDGLPALLQQQGVPADRLVLRADQAVRYDFIKQVLVLLGEHGVKNVTFAAVQTQQNNP